MPSTPASAAASSLPRATCATEADGVSDSGGRHRLRRRDTGHRDPRGDEVVADHPRRPRVPAVRTDQPVVEARPSRRQQVLLRSPRQRSASQRRRRRSSHRRRPRRPSAAASRTGLRPRPVPQPRSKIPEARHVLRSSQTEQQRLSGHAARARSRNCRSVEPQQTLNILSSRHLNSPASLGSIRSQYCGARLGVDAMTSLSSCNRDPPAGSSTQQASASSGLRTLSDRSQQRHGNRRSFQCLHSEPCRELSRTCSSSDLCGHQRERRFFDRVRA